jgi:acyl-CoA thioesterase-1
MSRVWIAWGLALSFAAGSLAAQEPKKKAPADAIVDNPRLPRVLVIGDSISIGYTPPLRDLLKDVANVHHNAGNAADTANGAARVQAWIGAGKWDVIHVNFGLHDIKLGNGKHQVAPEDYEKNLRAIVKALKATNATIIWCATTPVPEGTLSPPRKNDDVIAYNAIAKKVMDENKIPTNDLYAFALPLLKEIQLPSNVHFTQAGSKKLAEKVADELRSHLKK